MATVDQERVDRLKVKYGGELTEDETQFLRDLQQRFRNLLAARRGFNSVAKNIATELDSIVQDNFDVSVHGRANVDIHVFKESFGSDMPLCVTGDAPLTDWEEQFCRDAIGAIDFVMRNGIGFGLIVNLLCHDLHEIIFIHGSLDKARGRGFSPKVSGWGKYDASDVGVPDEAGD